MEEALVGHVQHGLLDDLRGALGGGGRGGAGVGRGTWKVESSQILAFSCARRVALAPSVSSPVTDAGLATADIRGVRGRERVGNEGLNGARVLWRLSVAHPPAMAASTPAAAPEVHSIDALLEDLPAEKQAKIRQLLYGKPVDEIPLPPAVAEQAKEGPFEVKAFKFSAAREQLRAPRVVRIGLIQHSIGASTTAPVLEQYKAIEAKVRRMIDAAGAMKVNVLCLQEAWTVRRRSSRAASASRRPLSLPLPADAFRVLHAREAAVARVCRARRRDRPLHSLPAGGMRLSRPLHSAPSAHARSLRASTTW